MHRPGLGQQTPSFDQTPAQNQQAYRQYCQQPIQQKPISKLRELEEQRLREQRERMNSTNIHAGVVPPKGPSQCQRNAFPLNQQKTVPQQPSADNQRWLDPLEFSNWVDANDRPPENLSDGHQPKTQPKPLTGTELIEHFENQKVKPIIIDFLENPSEDISIEKPPTLEELQNELISEPAFEFPKEMKNTPYPGTPFMPPGTGHGPQLCPPVRNPSGPNFRNDNPLPTNTTKGDIMNTEKYIEQAKPYPQQAPFKNLQSPQGYPLPVATPLQPDPAPVYQPFKKLPNEDLDTDYSMKIDERKHLENVLTSTLPDDYMRLISEGASEARRRSEFSASPNDSSPDGPWTNYLLNGKDSITGRKFRDE